MAEDILHRCLSGDLTTKDLYVWILQKKYSDDFIHSSPGEFISSFLNFVHESAISVNIDPNTLQKMENHTPKSIRPPSRDITKPRRRPALFSDQSEQDCTDVLLGTTLPSTDSSPTINMGVTQAQSVVCPISPLHSVNTPIRWRNQPLKQSTPNMENKGLCLGDFISYSGSAKKSSAKKKGQRPTRELETNQTRQQKRINPVLPSINVGQSNTNGNSFNFESVDRTTEIASTPVNLTTGEKSIDITSDTNLPITPNRNLEIEPNLSLVTFRTYLDNCINIYLFLLKNNLTLNILSEFYFLTTLLLTRKYVIEGFQEDVRENTDMKLKNLKDLFSTIHNVAYFASKVLKELIDFIRIFDRATIKFLLDNSRVATFVEISKELQTLYNAKLSAAILPTTSTSSSTSAVHFSADTDGRPNFTSDAAFNAFRRQRDAFYDLLHTWQQHNSNTGLDGVVRKGDLNMRMRVRLLLAMNVEGDADYTHLARLWRRQMLADCCAGETPASDNDSHLISALPHLHPDKLSLLRTRLTTRQHPPTAPLSTIPAAIASAFPGAQEFYRDFMLAADSAAWCSHLRDALASELMRVYGEMRGDHTDDGGGSVLASGTIVVMKVLAKFIGLLESIPYHLRKDLLQSSRNLSASAGDLRQHYQPTLDVLGCLQRAVEEGGLVITVPWLVEYCAMLDAGVVRVAYYERLFKILFQVYHNSKQQDFKNNSSNLIILCLGWLFEIPHFPSELYYMWYNNRPIPTVKTDSICQRSDNSKGVKQALSIDQLSVIDEAVLYATCPYLGELRRLLLSNQISHNNMTVKHITPVSAVEENSPEVTERKLKAQLEEAFFNAQPGSVRKIVDFVSERVASTSVKIICNKIVPTYRKSTVESFKTFLLEKQIDEHIDLEQFRCIIEGESIEFQARSLKYLQILCASEAKQIIQSRVFVVTQLLLSEEELPQTKVTCGEIAARISYEKVQNWICSHVRAGVLSKEFQTEVDKYISKRKGGLQTADFKLTFQLPPGGRTTNHNDETSSAVSLVENIRKTMLATLENTLVITTDCLIDEIIKDACDTLTQRCDVNDCMLFLINKLLVDLLILLVAYKPDFVTTPLIRKFISFWSNYCLIGTTNPNTSTENLNLSKYQSNSSVLLADSFNSSLMECLSISNNSKAENVMKRLFNCIICPRNVMILSSRGGNGNVSSFRVFAVLVVELLQRDLISCNDIEEQVVALYRHEWDDIILQRISIFIVELVGRCKTLKTDERFELLLNFLSSFCASDFE